MSRRLILIISGCVLVVIVAAISSLLLIDVNKYRPRIQSELQKKLDRPVTLGQLNLKIFPLSIRVDGLSIGESPAFPSGRPFATAKNVSASASLFSLIRGNPEIKSLALDRPQIELIRNASGVWNFSTIGGSQKPAAAASQQPASAAAPQQPATTAAPRQPASGESPSEFTLNNLKITDGQIAVTDEFAKQPRSVYDHVDLELSGYAPNKRFDVDLGVHFPGGGKELLAFKGRVGPLQSGNTAATPIDGKLSLQEVSLAAVNRFAAGTLPDKTDATASGETDITSKAETLACTGTLKLENAVIRGAQLDYPINAKYDLTNDRKQDRIQIKSGTVNLGPTAFAISGEVNSSTKPANLNLHLNTTNSSITELARLAGAFGIAFNPAYQVKGTVSANVTAKGPATAPQLEGSLDARQVQARGGEIKQTILVPQLALNFSPDVIRSNPFTAQSGSTTIAGAFTLAQYTSNTPNADVTLQTNGADIAELLNMLKAYGFDAGKDVSATGKISLNLRAQGPLSKGTSLVNIATGTGTIDANTIKAQEFVLSNVHANCNLNRGVVQLSPLTADIFSGKETGAVTIDLRPVHSLCSINAKLAGADANAALSTLTSMKNTLYGSLAADANVNFTMASGAELTRTLNGTLGFNVANGQLKNINILNELSKIGKFVGAVPAQSGSGTALRTFSGTLNVTNGIATTNNLVAALDAGSLSANGSMNLVDQALNLHMNAVLSNGISNTVGGTKVGGFLNTTLANNKGELVLPVIVTGTTDHPVFSPDVQAIAKMKMNNLLPTTGDPAKLTTGNIVNSILGGGQKSTQQGQQQQQQQANPIDSLFNKFGKKKPKQ